MASVQLTGLTNPVQNVGSAIFNFHSPLIERIAISHGHRAIFKRLTVNGNTVRRANFILASITTSDGAFFVIKDRHVLLQFQVDFLCNLRHCRPFFTRGNYGCFDRRQARMKFHQDAEFCILPFLIRCLIFRETPSQRKRPGSRESAPADGSITCGVNFSLVASSRY